MNLRIGCTVLSLASLLALPAWAKEPESCHNVRFAEIGWSDIAATTGIASVVFSGLGYKPTSSMASEPITFAGLKNKQLDIYLGYWVPSQTAALTPFIKAGTVKVLPTPNLDGAKYTLAVPDYVAAAGVKSFADLAKNRDKFDGKIYGIEPGSQGNGMIKKMIDTNDFGLKDFKLVESSEAGMLVEAQRAVKQKKWVVFLGWEPHPMNFMMKLTYLAGGDKYFGADYGGSKVYTAVATNYLNRCPNAGKLVSQLKFTIDMESHVMEPIMRKVEPTEAAKDWLKRNPQVLETWLQGVKTFDGKPGLPAVKAYLGV